MWKTIDIVPSSIRDDPQVVAACEAIDKELLAIYDCAASVPGGILFWPFVDKQVPPLLDILAWEYHVDVWAGWSGDLDNETKQRLVAQSIDWHRHKGTRYAVDQMLKEVFKQGTVTEWYEYGGNPFFFRISFEGDITGTQWEQIKTAVFAVKNVRSWLDGFMKARLYKQQTLLHAIATTQHISTKIKYTDIVHPPSPTYDYDAFNFMVRAKITSTTQKTAINTLVLALKSANVWTRMKAIYPFVGGTSSAHRENLKLPDHQIIWNGLITHNANGITGLGGTGDTGLNTNTFNVGSMAFGIYDKTSTSEAARQLSVYVDPGDYSIRARFTDNKAYGIAGLSSGPIQATSNDAKGFWVVSRTQLTLTNFYKDGTSIGSIATQDSLPNRNFFILGETAATSTHNLAFAFISTGLSGPEISQLNTAVVAFQNALGRKNN